MKWTCGLCIFLLLPVLGLPEGGQAQEVVTVQSNRGWIGVTFNYATGWISGEERTVVVIEDVAEGSPAEEAGIQVGDTLTHLDGQPISQRVFSSLGTLEVGDLVRMTIRRDYRPLEVLVEAGPRQPTGWVIAPNSGEMVIHLDSIRGAILENLDSLRLNIARGGSDSPAARGEFLFQEFGPVPFRAFFMDLEETEPLRGELQRLRKALTEVRRAELSRIRELEGGTRRPLEELARTDETIQALRAREDTLLREQAAATRKLQRLSEELVQQRMARFQEEQERAWVQFQEAQAGHEGRWRPEERTLRGQYELRRPSSHVILGQAFVAGAQLTLLNPNLAEYFQVEEGVLVTEVLAETPADQAGMQAGDVIVRVGSEPVSSLEDLRFAVGYMDRPLRIQVIRKGSPVEIVIRK